MDCTASSIELCEASNVLLMTLMEEENQEDHYYYQNFEDERLVSMIQLLEAEINSINPMLMVGQVEGQDCSTPPLPITDDCDWVMEDMEVVPSISSSFDDDLSDIWSACAEMDNEDYYYDQFNYCGVSWVAASDAEL